MSTAEPPYPIHPDILPLVDPQYVEFYNKYIINQQQVHYQPVAASRTSGVLIPGAGEPLKVASIKDYNFARKDSQGELVSVRVFTPSGEAPEGGWPGFLYMHGGGWVLGNINTENVHCTNWCARAKCVVVSVNYRLAPEIPFPAAVEDTWESYRWMAEQQELLNVNSKKFAAGGSSAGGNLTAVLSHMITEYNLKNSSSPVPNLIFEMLVVPVCDNNANQATYESWKNFQFTCALPAEKMIWYRRHYLPDESTWTDPRASPINYTDVSFKSSPPTFIACAGLDVLTGEAERYHQKLLKNGVKSTIKIYPGVPHPVMAMDGVLDKGAELVTDCCEALKKALYP